MLSKKPWARIRLAALPALVALLAGSVPRASGQAAAPQSTTTATTKTDDDTVLLSPFTVTSEDDHGYAATSTLAGTRLRTDLRDVGAAVSVVTKDFLRDTGATNAGTLLTYLTNTEVAGVHGNYSGFGNTGAIQENYLNPQSTTRVRGLDNADNTRDYFVSSIPWDSFNVDRVDTIRGPNSILYGLGSPAGIINTSLNQANFRNATTIEARYGRFGTARGSLDTNLVLIPKQLAIRFDAVGTRTKFQQEEAFNNDYRVYGALKYQPSVLNTDNMSTTISGNIESGRIVSNNPEQSPPADMITPWFDPAKANKFVSDPFADWTANGLGPTYTPHGVINQDPATAVPTGKGQAAYANGSPNPYYQPWMSTMGFQGGTTFLTGVGAQTPYGLTFWQPQLSIGNYPSVNGHAINGIPYNQVNGIAGYHTYAQQAALPQWQTGLYKDYYITDPSIFDFRHHMIGGDNARQYQKWTAYSASLAQTFYKDRFGYELVAREEQYHSSQWRLFDGPGSINIVTDAYTVEGGANPNFGRPFLNGSGQYSNSSVDDTRQNARLTAFGELRGDDLFGANTLTAHVFGRQRFTGLYSKDEDNRENRNWMLYATDPAYNALYNQGTTQQQNLTSYAPHIVSFLGGSLFNATTASGANLTPAGTIHLPTDGATRQWIAKWIAPSTVDPTAPWTPPTGGDPLTNADNPANYQGWTTVPVHVLSAFNGDQDQLYTGGQKQQTKVTSEAAIWQGFFLDGTIVPLVGIRRDTVKTAYAQPQRNANNTFNISDPSYRVGTSAVEKGTTRTYSVVAHLPQQWREKLPLGLDISAFYNQSENFQPGAGRVDVFGDAISDPNGKTKDYGILVSLLDQRITFKVNRFKTDLQNANLNGLSTWDLGASVTWNWEFDQFYKNHYGQDWQNHFNPWSNQTAAEAAAQQAAAVAAVDQIASDPLYQRFLKAWQINPTGNAWQTIAMSYTTPAGFSQTQDTHSKGWEYEVTTQVTKNWTLTANASKTDAVVSNVGGSGLNQWVKFWTNAINGPVGDIRLWWGGSTTTTRTDFTGSFLSGWQLAQLGAGADVSEMRPWHFNVVTNYRFDESALKGLSVGGGYRWASHNILGYPTALDASNVYHFDLAKPYYGRDESAIDLWIGYDFKPARKTTWHLQFNVRNAFGSQKLIPVTIEPDGTPAAYRIPEPVTWEWSTRVSF